MLLSKNPKELSKTIEDLRQEIINDDYYKEIPSIKKTAKMFHATDDCQEVREKVFRLLKKSGFTFYCIVARKKIYSEKSLICNLQIMFCGLFKEHIRMVILDIIIT